MTEGIIEILGTQGGPTSIILAGVHGDERCGVKALEELLPTLHILRGRVFIAYGNPRAIEKNVRYTDVNLNRMFKAPETLTPSELKSYEYARATFLKTYLDRSDALLDIHASFTPKSRRFIISEPNAAKIYRYLPFNLIVSGFDKVEPGGTDYYMNSRGKIGICAECGYLGDTFSVDVAKKSILDFLCIQGHIAGNIERQDQKFISMYYLYCTMSDRFRLSKQFADFEDILAGQQIGTDKDKDVYSPKDGIILFARNMDQVGEEAFLLGEYKKDLAL